MKNYSAKREKYNHDGLGSVTILLAIITISFIMYNVFQVIL
jgi:hypothetical protein